MEYSMKLFGMKISLSVAPEDEVQKNKDNHEKSSQESNVEPCCSGSNEGDKMDPSETIKAVAASITQDQQAQDKQHAKLKRPDKPVPCPRCHSMDTKFCYFNNYNVNQPRHFCKNCQRYWTAGGTLRNVPVGAGRRKSKHQPKQTKDDAQPVQAGGPGLKVAHQANDIVASEASEGSNEDSSKDGSTCASSITQQYQGQECSYSWPFALLNGWIYPNPSSNSSGSSSNSKSAATLSWPATQEGDVSVLLNPARTKASGNAEVTTLGKHHREIDLETKDYLWVPKSLRMDDGSPAQALFLSNLRKVASISHDVECNISSGGMFKPFNSE